MPVKWELGVTSVMLPELSFDQQIDLCAKSGVKYYQYRSRVIDPAERGNPFSFWGNHLFDCSPQLLLKDGAALTRKLRDAGLEPWGTLPTMDLHRSDDEIKLCLDAAAAADAGRMRFGAFSYPNEPFDYPDLLKRSIERFEHIITTLAKPRGIKLIVETHTGSLAASPALAWNLCRSFDPADMGVIFDIANFGLEGALQPALAVAVLRAHIDCIHIGGTRRVRSGTDAHGCAVWQNEQCPMREAALNLPSWIAALKAAGITAPLIIEDFRTNIDTVAKVRENVEFLTSLINS